MTTESMDITDRKLLNIIQSNFPVVEEPYQAIAQELDITEDDLLARLAELKRQNVVRQISAIFDTRRLGYKTTLVAFAYGDGDLHDGAILHQPPSRRQPQLRPRGFLLQPLVHPRRPARWRPGNHRQVDGRENRRHRVPDHAHHPVLQDRRQLRHGQAPQRRLQLQPRRHRRSPVLPPPTGTRLRKSPSGTSR